MKANLLQNGGATRAPITDPARLLADRQPEREAKTLAIDWREPAYSTPWDAGADWTNLAIVNRGQVAA